MYKCKKCDFVCDRQIELAAHGNKHNNQECSCKICGKIFLSLPQLKGHLSSHNRKIKTKVEKPKKEYKCKFCETTFNNGLSLGGHQTHCKLNPRKNETKDKISKAGMNRKVSDETKLKLSVNKLNYLRNNPDKVPYLLNHSSKMSYPENVFKNALEAADITGWVYNHQNSIYQYDFAFLDKKIDVEIDGGTHLTEKVKKIDKRRDKFSNENGWIVIRFTAKEVKENVIKCIEKLKQILNNDSVRLVGRQ